MGGVRKRGESEISGEEGKIERVGGEGRENNTVHEFTKLICSEG